jgi:hypothetical protein
LLATDVQEFYNINDLTRRLEESFLKKGKILKEGIISPLNESSIHGT